MKNTSYDFLIRFFFSLITVIILGITLLLLVGRPQVFVQPANAMPRIVATLNCATPISYPYPSSTPTPSYPYPVDDCDYSYIPIALRDFDPSGTPIPTIIPTATLIPSTEPIYTDMVSVTIKVTDSNTLSVETLGDNDYWIIYFKGYWGTRIDNRPDGGLCQNHSGPQYICTGTGSWESVSMGLYIPANWECTGVNLQTLVGFFKYAISACPPEAR